MIWIGWAVYIVFVLCAGILLYFTVLQTWDCIRLSGRLGKLIRDHSRPNPGQDCVFIGQAKIDGDPLTAPLSGEPCIYYHTEIDQFYSRSRKRVLDKKDAIPFRLETFYGNLVLNSGDEEKEKKVYYSDLDRREVSFLKKANPEMTEMLARVGMNARDYEGLSSSLMSREEKLPLNKTLYILGKMVDPPSATPEGGGEGPRQDLAMDRSDATGTIVIADNEQCLAKAVRDAAIGSAFLALATFCFGLGMSALVFL